MIKRKIIKVPLYEYVIKLFLFSLLYFASARFGLSMATINQSVSPVWPATGMAFSILILGGLNYWPSIAIGAFLINFLTNPTFLSALGITFGNTLQALVGFWLFYYFKNKKDKIGYHSRSLGVVSASFIGALLTASIGTTFLYLTKQISSHLLNIVWLTWFTGDALGGITFLPLMLSFSKKFSTDYTRPRPSFLIIFALLVSGLLLGWLLFIRQKGSPYLFFIFPYLFCCVALAGERGASLGTILISLFGVYSTKFGHGVFNHGSTNENLVNLQLFLASVGTSSLLMTDIKRNSSLKRPAIVLFFSWLLAGFLFLGFYLKFEYESHKQFQETISNVRPILEVRMNLYYSALKSGSGLFAASEIVTQNEWKQFLELAEYQDQLQAIEGLGVIFRVSKDILPKFIKFHQKGGAHDFNYQVYPTMNAKTIKDNQLRRDAYIITYIEPLEKNRNKIGYDIASEDKRREAAEQARDSGEPTISNQISIINALENESTFYIYNPIYSKGLPIRLKSERRSRLLGWIFAPIKASLFFDSALSLKNFENLSYSVSEELDKTPFTFSPDFFLLPSSFTEKRIIQLANKKFYFTFKRSKIFYFNQDNYSSWVGAVASIICLLIGTIIVSLQFIKNEALELAEKQRRQLHSIVEGSSDALMLLGSKGFIDCNSRTLRLFGLDNKSEFIALHPAQISPPIQPDGQDSKTKANEQIKKAYTLGVNQFEWVHQKKTGETFPAEVFLTAFDYENERIIQACIRDITERKEVEKALISQREKLVAAAKMSSLGEMAGGIAHEINNPLAIIIGKMTQIRRRLKEQENQESNPNRLFEDLDVIENTAKRISAIIKGLSAFSRNAENDQMDHVRVSLLIQDTIELSKERFSFSSVELKLKISSTESTVILGRTSQLLQVLINLLNNAYDAVEHLQEKWVEIEVSTNQQMCIISVTDSGPGIPTDLLAKMMTPFFTTKTIGKGTGLGLSISKRIIEEHNGNLYYDRTSPHTRFVVELPLA